MELTDKVYLKRQYIDPRGNLIIPGEYLYGELNEFIRDNKEYVVKADEVVITNIPLRVSTDITNITAVKPDEKIEAQLFNVQYADKVVKQEDVVEPVIPVSNKVGKTNARKAV